MEGKTKQGNRPTSMNIDDRELQKTMHKFMEDEETPNYKIWNFSTIMGIVMVFVGMLYLVQLVGLGIGPDLSGIMEFMTYLGGALVALVGFGFLVGDRAKEKSSKSGASDSFNFDDHFDKTEGKSDYNFSGKEGAGQKGYSSAKSQASSYDQFGLNQPKKLYKSRTDKKIMGVCGGLAKYTGISTTVIRFLFFFAMLAGWGAPLIIYLVLAIVLDKEPPELMDDFNY